MQKKYDYTGFILKDNVYHPLQNVRVLNNHHNESAMSWYCDVRA